jgi:hypothetical protein
MHPLASRAPVALALGAGARSRAPASANLASDGWQR